MNNTSQVKDPVSSALPRTTPFQAPVPSSSASMSTSLETTLPAKQMVGIDGQDRTGVFRNLVTGDGDIAGLVAYSIYKQNKLDWLRAFQAAQGRQPNDAELASYIIGEGTPRRLATYRHLAEATLSGNGPNVGEGLDAGHSAQLRRSAFGDKNLFKPGLIAVYLLIAALFVLGFSLALHYTMTTR